MLLQIFIKLYKSFLNKNLGYLLQAIYFKYLIRKQNYLWHQ